MKTTNDAKGINFLDLCILLVVVAALIFGVGSLTGMWNGTTKSAKDRISFSVELKNQDKAILSYIEEESAIYDGVSKQHLGTVTAIHSYPSTELVENHDEKSIKKSLVPDKIDVVLDISARAEITAPDIKIGDYVLKVGKSIHCLVGDAAGSGTIIRLEQEEIVPTKGEASK